MKNIMYLFSLALFLFLVSCSPAPLVAPFQTEAAASAVATSADVQIPPQIIALVTGVALALFTTGFIYIFEKTGLDLRQYAMPIAGTLATWAVTELQGWINLLPDTTDPYLNLLFTVILALIPAAGVLRLFSYQPATLIEHDVQRHK